jgi:hypothetical protein
MAAAESLFSGQIAIPGGKCLAIASFIISPVIGLRAERWRDKATSRSNSRGLFLRVAATEAHPKTVRLLEAFS